MKCPALPAIRRETSNISGAARAATTHGRLKMSSSTNSAIRSGRRPGWHSPFWLRFTQQKNRNRKPITLELPLLPALQEIVAASRTGDLTFLVTEHGQPFTANGFGNKMRQWCDEAELPECTAHGLRKAGATIAAENGATAHQLMSIFGWLTLKEAERYTRAAEQKRLAAGAMSLLERKST